MNKITVKEFVEKFLNEREIDDDVTVRDYVKKNLEVIPYVPIAMKANFANGIVEASYVADEYGRRVKNSYFRYVLQTKSLITLWTNLTVNNQESQSFIDEYDMLCGSGLLDEVISAIPEKEYTEFINFISMYEDDYVTNNLTFEAFVSNQVTRFGTLTGKILEPALNTLNDLLGDMTEEDAERIGKKINNFTETVLKFVKK